MEGKSDATQGWRPTGTFWPGKVISLDSPPRGTPPHPPPVVTSSQTSSAFARRQDLPALRVSQSGSLSSSTASTVISTSTGSSVPALSGAFGGRSVHQAERKTHVPDALVLAVPQPSQTSQTSRVPAQGAPVRPLHGAGGMGGSSPEMVGFHAVARHLPALPLARALALQEEAGSDGKLRRQLARALTETQLRPGGEQEFPEVCARLLALNGFSPAVIGLLAGAMALELGIDRKPQAERDRQLAGVVDEALRAPGAARSDLVGMAILEALCEVVSASGPGMPQAAPFVRLVLDRLLVPASSARSMALLRLVTTRMLAIVAPAQLTGFLHQVLDEEFLPGEERVDRLRALVGGLGDKTRPPPSDACVGQLLRHVLEAGYPERDLIAFATELQRFPVLWQQACKPGILQPVPMGRLLLAGTGVGVNGERTPKPLEQASPRLAVSFTTTQSSPLIETKSGPGRTQVLPVRVDRVAQVLSLQLPLQERLEGLLAREIVAVYRALEGATDAEEARQTLLLRILDAAPGAYELTNAAMACGWGIAVRAEAMDEPAFAALSDAFMLPHAQDAVAWLANGSFALGLAAARDLNHLPADLAIEPEQRILMAQVCREARGPLGDAAFAAELMRHPELQELPQVAAGWLDALVRCFSGPDFELLATARSYLVDHAQALHAEVQGDDAFAAAYGLDLISQFAGRLHAAAYNVVSCRHDHGLWMTDAAERTAMLGLAREALAFLEREREVYLDEECPLTLPQEQMSQLTKYLAKIRSAIARIEPPSTEASAVSWSLTGPLVAVGTSKPGSRPDAKPPVNPKS